MEAEVGEQGNVLGALLALGELGEDEEAPPALALAHADALEADGDVVEVALGDVAALHDAHGADLLEAEVDEGGDDGDGEDPLGDLEVDGRLDLGGPLVKGEQVDGGEQVDAVDGQRDDEHEPQVEVGERGEASSRPEVVEALLGSADVVVRRGSRLTM